MSAHEWLSAGVDEPVSGALLERRELAAVLAYWRGIVLVRTSEARREFVRKLLEDLSGVVDAVPTIEEIDHLLAAVFAPFALLGISASRPIAPLRSWRRSPRVRPGLRAALITASPNSPNLPTAHPAVGLAV